MGVWSRNKQQTHSLVAPVHVMHVRTASHRPVWKLVIYSNLWHFNRVKIMIHERIFQGHRILRQRHVLSLKSCELCRKHSFELQNHLVVSLCTHESPWDGCTSINMVKWCEMSPKFLPPNLFIALHHAHGPPCSACHGPAPGLVPGGSTPWRHGGRGDPRRCRRPTSRRRCWKGVKRLVVG